MVEWGLYYYILPHVLNAQTFNSTVGVKYFPCISNVLNVGMFYGTGNGLKAGVYFRYFCACRGISNL